MARRQPVPLRETLGGLAIAFVMITIGGIASSFGMTRALLYGAPVVSASVVNVTPGRGCHGCMNATVAFVLGGEEVTLEVDTPRETKRGDRLELRARRFGDRAKAMHPAFNSLDRVVAGFFPAIILFMGVWVMLIAIAYAIRGRDTQDEIAELRDSRLGALFPRIAQAAEDALKKRE